ncbi:LysR family transcriptional regulator [Altererythrobacter sp. CC-YST694]|nr:LysR family transcriptional regulator [Altererythrobacter sp. CC-YST694]
MNFQQLRYVGSAIRNDFNLTKVASELFTSQPGVSKQIKELEAELKIEIFVRRGKRLVGLTEAGHSVVEIIERLLVEADNLKRLSDDFVDTDKGRLIIATTHNQANYVLPRVLLDFRREFPKVEVELRQGSPGSVVEMVLHGKADIGVATEAMEGRPALRTFSCFTWEHVAIVPPDHPLAAVETVTLQDLAAYPVITYTSEYSGRSRIDAAFERAGVRPDIRLAAVDAGVIKTYVKLGMGVGIVAQMAVENGSSDGLAIVRGSSKLFDASSTKVAIAKSTLVRSYIARFIRMLAPHVEERQLKRQGEISIDPAKLHSFAEREDLHIGRGTSVPCELAQGASE